MRLNEPSGERDSKVEVEGSKETLADELLKKSRPAKIPTRPTVPMRSKSTRGVSAQKTTLRRARTAMQYQRGRKGYVFIVDLLDTTYEGEVEGEVGRGRPQKTSGGFVAQRFRLRTVKPPWISASRPPRSFLPSL